MGLATFRHIAIRWTPRPWLAGKRISDNTDVANVEIYKMNLWRDLKLCLYCTRSMCFYFLSLQRRGGLQIPRLRWKTLGIPNNWQRHRKSRDTGVPPARDGLGRSMASRDTTPLPPREGWLRTVDGSSIGVGRRGDDGTGAGFQRPGRQRLGSPAGWLMANRKRNMVEEEGERRRSGGSVVASIRSDLEREPRGRP